jgi:2-oxoglutarate ferredoxin oxidoreductase subunit beta
MSEPQNNVPEVYYLDEEIAEMKESGILDYRSDRLPTWCPGCGYFGIQNALTKAIKELGIESHELVAVSGIGCTGRYPFFIKGYGFHSLHGRALPVATGAKAARPELNVIALTGDGDCLGIGAGHLPHAARRNVDMLCVLFDNGIYGLTKGQTSPTTPSLQNTNSHPYGNPDPPLKPIRFALSVGATFVARAFAGLPEDMAVIFREAMLHKGFSFVHVVSPCVTFDKSNFTYQKLRERLMLLPKRHDYTNLDMAMDRALDPELFLGLFYKEERPTFSERMSSYAGRAVETG